MRRIILTALTALCCSSLLAQSQFDVLPYWKYYQVKPGESYDRLMETALQQLDKRNNRVASIRSAAEWAKYREDLKAAFMKSLGEFPAKTPLNAKTTSTVEVNGIVAENILFESLPGYYVSSSLFKRKDLTNQKLPVIVFCSGHSSNGYRSDAYQQMILNYAKKGFAVFAFDPVGQGERVQYRKEDGTAAMGTTHDHSYSGSKAFLLGYSPAKYFVWDGIRAIDYLETRADIDIKRVGIAGRSGGGTQSSYIAAIDNRVLAAAPECYITSYEMLLKSKGPQDAEQVFLSGIANGFDIPDLLHMRAPKATLVVTTTNDIFSVQGAHDVNEEMSRFYGMVGKSENFQTVEDYAAHASTRLNREACYRFFAKHLNNPCDTSDETVKFFTDEQLYAAPEGNVFKIAGSKRLDEVIGENAPKQAPFNLEAVRKSLNYKKSAAPSSSVISGRVLFRDYSADKYLVKAPAGNYFPVLIFHKTTPVTGKKGVVLYLDERGKSADTTRILKLLDKYEQVITADLSGMGELKEYYNWYGDALIQGTPLNLWYLGLLTNQTLAQYRLGEIDALYAFIRAQKGVSDVVGIASGTLTTDLLHWSALNKGRLKSLSLINPLVSYRDLLAAGDYKVSYLLNVGGGMLKSYDLPDLFKQFQPAELRLINPVNSNREEPGTSALDNRTPRESVVFVSDVNDAI